MFNTSENYYNAVYVSPVVKRTISGSIVVDESTTINLSDRDIIAGSLQIDNKCVNGDSFEYGAVFQGELNVTLRLSINRYQLYGKKISFRVHQTLADGTNEEIPLGIFTITDPQWSKKLLTIKAVDGMENFDIGIDESFFGSLHDVLSVAATNCGVELAQSEEELTALTNGEVQYSCYNTQIATYRDLLAYLAKCTCTFATINRHGKLELRPYGAEVAREIPISRRKDTVIADYETYHQGVKARFLANQNFAPYEHIEAGETGLVLDLGDIPVVYGTSDIKQAAIDAIWETLAAVRYTPANFNLLISDPALELGDLIRVKGKTAEEDVTTYITAYTWIYHGAMAIKGVGGNPRLAKLKNKNQVDMTDLESQIAAKDMIVYTYTNAQKFTIQGESEKIIIRISYTTVAETVPIFMATVPVEMGADGYLKLKYKKNDAEIEGSEIIKYLPKGKHFVTFMYYLKDKANTWNKIEVVASTAYFESTDRVNTAEITALKTFAASGTLPAAVIDSTVPAATIEKQTIKAVLFGQGLATDQSEWDGRISITEELPRFNADMKLKSFAYEMVLAQQQPKKGTFTETIGRFNAGMSLRGFTEAIGISEVIKKETIDSDETNVVNYEFNAAYVIVGDSGFSLNKNFASTSSAAEIDSGSMCSVAVDLTPFAAVESVVIM